MTFEKNSVLKRGTVAVGAVSISLNDSWTGRSILEAINQQKQSNQYYLQPATSLPSLTSMRYQAKQQQEREQKRIELGTTSQRKMTNLDSSDNKKLGSSLGVGKVRQMFHERRQRGTGIDKSYPLQPIITRTSPSTIALTTGTTTTTMTSTLDSSKYLTNGRKTVGSVSGGDFVKKPVTLSSTTKRTIIKNSINGHAGDAFSKPGSPDEFGDDFLDNEQFPDTSLTFDDDLNNNYQIAAKLPNVGKINTKLIKNTVYINNNNSANNNNNTMKLKPIITSPTAKKTINNTNIIINNNNNEKSSLTPTKPLINGNRKMTPITKVKAPSSILRTNNNLIITTKAESPEKTNLNDIKPTTAIQKKTKMIKIKSKSKSGGTVKSKMDFSVESQQIIPENSAQCRVCGRYFLEDRIQKHEEICMKTTAKKRKVFDITNHRIKGTEAEPYIKKITKTIANRPKTSGMASDDPNSKKSDWRRKHEEFINAIKAAKELKKHLARGGKLSDLPPPPPSENLDYITCPHCNRRFNEAAADRHIPKCATMLHNKPRNVPKRK